MRGNENLTEWFEWTMSLKGSGMWTLGPQLVVQFGEVMGPLGGELSRWRKYVAGGRLWSVSVHFLFTLSFLCLKLKVCSFCFLLRLPVTVPLLPLWTLSGTTSPRSLVHPFILVTVPHHSHRKCLAESGLWLAWFPTWFSCKWCSFVLYVAE